MNQKARKVLNAVMIVALLAQTIFLPNYVYAQQVIATPPGAAQIINNGERFMDSAPLAIGNALQLAQSLEQISQSDLQTVPAEWFVAARQESLQVAQQTAVAQGALGGILAGAEKLGISAQDAVDLDALITDINTDGFSEELETAFIDAGLTITQVAALETGAAGNFNQRRDIAQNGFNVETVALMQSLGLSGADINEVEEAYSSYGVADAALPDKLAQLGGTQAEFTFVRDAALTTYIQLLSQQVYRAQLNEETGRPIASADIDTLAADQLRLLTHIAYLNALWGGESRPDVGEGQWLFVERYSWRVVERLDALILETHNLGLAVDLLVALQIHTTALTAQSGDPVLAKLELDKLAEIQATLVGDNVPGGQSALQSTPSLLWRVAVFLYDKTGEEHLLQWVSREELVVAETAVTVATDEAYGRLTRLAKPAQIPTFSGVVDESDETNNTDLALFYTSRATLPDNILSLLEGFIPNFGDVLDFVWGVISGQSDNPLAIGINIVLSFVPVLGEILDLIALFTEPTVWGKAMALIGLAASIASDGSQLLAFLGITIPVAITTEIADIAAAILKNVTKFVSAGAASVIARIPFDQALRRGVEVIEFIGRRIIEGSGNLIARIEEILSNSRDAFSALLTRFGDKLDTLYRIGFGEGGYFAGRVLHLSDEAAAFSDEAVEGLARMGDDIAKASIELSDEAAEGFGDATKVLGEQRTRQLFFQCFVGTAAGADNDAARLRLSKPSYQTPPDFLCDIGAKVFKQLGDNSTAQSGFLKLAQIDDVNLVKLNKLLVVADNPTQLDALKRVLTRVNNSTGWTPQAVDGLYNVIGEYADAAAAARLMDTLADDDLAKNVFRVLEKMTIGWTDEAMAGVGTLLKHQVDPAALERAIAGVIHQSGGARYGERIFDNLRELELQNVPGLNEFCRDFARNPGSITGSRFVLDYMAYNAWIDDVSANLSAAFPRLEVPSPSPATQRRYDALYRDGDVDRFMELKAEGIGRDGPIQIETDLTTLNPEQLSNLRWVLTSDAAKNDLLEEVRRIRPDDWEDVFDPDVNIIIVNWNDIQTSLRDLWDARRGPQN